MNLKSKNLRSPMNLKHDKNESHLRIYYENLKHLKQHFKNIPIKNFISEEYD